MSTVFIWVKANTMKPGFFIIGAARSGTTSLYAYLDQHPEVYFSEVKEVNFFSNPNVWKKGVNWYEKMFRGLTNEKIAGEASTSYTSSPFLGDAPQRLASYRPDAKLIYIVRDPIDRLISHYMHRVHRGIETRLFSEVIDNLESEPTAWQGRYYYQLQQYLEVFDKNQLLVISFEDLHQSSQAAAANIFRFIGVDSNFTVKNPDQVFNASDGTLRRSPFGLQILRLYRNQIEQRRLPYILKMQFLKLASIGAVKHPRPSLTPQEHEILANFYAEDAAKLAQEFGIDTNRWLSKRYIQSS